MIQINWTQFKHFIDTKQIRARCVAINDGYQIHGADQGLIYTCTVMSGEDDYTDFVDNYKDGLESQEAGGVTTRMEVDFLTLKLACATGQADANGDLIINVDVPGSPAAIQRYVAGGYAVTNNYAFGDRLTAVNVIDKDGVFSGNPGIVLRTYHDSEVPESSRGWYFWKAHGTEGEVEVEPIGWYGQLYGTMRMQCVFKVQPLAQVNIMIWWGKKE